MSGDVWDDPFYDQREEERTERRHAPDDRDWQPDDADLAELFPDAPRRHH